MSRTDHKLRRALDELRRLERAEPKERAQLTQAERRAARREREIPQNRVCPGCEDTVLNSRRWVISAVHGALCLSCYRTAVGHYDYRKEGAR